MMRMRMSPCCITSTAGTRTSSSTSSSSNGSTFALAWHVGMIMTTILIMTSTTSAFMIRRQNENRGMTRGLFMAEHRAELGLLTFDLDDTLYPIYKVEQAANEAVVKALAQYGFTSDKLQPDDIVETAKEIRREIGLKDSAAAAALTHNQVRELAIRREMEKIITAQKLQDCADDWATPIESLSPLVIANAKK